MVFIYRLIADVKNRLSQKKYNRLLIGACTVSSKLNAQNLIPLAAENSHLIINYLHSRTRREQVTFGCLLTWCGASNEYFGGNTDG